MAIMLRDEFQTIYIAPQHTVELSEFLRNNDNVDIAGCRIVKNAMDEISRKIAEQKNIFDSEDADREFVLKQAREKSKINVESVEELPKLEEIKLFKEYLLNLSTTKEYIVTKNYSREYIYPLLTLINIYKPSTVINISDKYFELALYISKTLYRKGSQAVLESTNEFIIANQDHSRIINFEPNNIQDKVYVLGYGDISFESLVSKCIVIPSYFGVEKINKDTKLKELWKDVIEIAMKNLERYYHERRETIKSFVGGS